MAEQNTAFKERVEQIEAIKHSVREIVKGSILSHIGEIPHDPLYDPERGFVVMYVALDRTEFSPIVDGIANALDAVGSTLCDAHNCSYYVDVLDAVDAYYVYLYVDF